jgi:hypothetical protein
MYNRTSPTGNPSLVTCCLMTLFIVHYLMNPQDCKSLSYRQNESPSEISKSVNKEGKFLVEDEGFPKWNYIKK